MPGPRFDPHSCGPFSGFAGPLSDALIAPVLDLERLDIADIQRRFAAGTLTQRAAREGLPGPDQVRQPARARASTPCARSTRARPAPRSPPTTPAPPASPAARWPASRCWSATRSTSPGCRPPAARSRSRPSCPTQDAAIVTKLKAAGAIILGKVNVTELNGMVCNGAPARLRLAARPGAEPVRHALDASTARAAARSPRRRPAWRRRPSAWRPTPSPTAPATRPTASRSRRSSRPSTPAWSRCARRSGSCRAPASCRPRAARRRRRRSAAPWPTWRRR